MSVLTLAAAKSHLNITTTTDDAELQSVIDAAEAAIAYRCGPLAPTSQTVRLSGGGPSLILPTAPVVSVESVTPVGGTALSMADMFVNKDAGTVSLALGGTFGAGQYDVSFTAGRSSVPADLLLAIKELVRHLWSTQRGNAPGAQTALPEDAAAAFGGGGFTGGPLSTVEQLIAPYEQVWL
ncbi:MAG: hypothetical protein HOQ21_11220 [Dermatophilaceae bacterium]|nr:hypothetical protein [Dermatophilaceae bacterium]